MHLPDTPPAPPGVIRTHTEHPDHLTGGAGGYFPAIDGLRAVAVLAVILFHLRPEWLPGGFAGVDLFFVISGFVVTSSLAGRRFASLRELLGYFYARRIVRILPALLAMLVVTAPLATLFMRRATFRSSADTAIPAFFGFSNVTLALTAEDYFAPLAELNPFLHTWTLGVEEQFYLVFPLFIYLFRRAFTAPRENRRALLSAGAACVLSFALCGVLATTQPRYAFYLMPPRLWELGVGVALCLAMYRWRPRVGALGRPAAMVAALTAAGALAATFLYAPAHRFPFPVALVPVAGAAGLIALVCARPASPLARMLSHPAPVFVGRLSYSLYLWHWPVFVLFRWTVGLDGVVRGGAALLVSAGAALASYYLVEQPLRRAQGVRALPRRRVLVLGGATALVCAAVSWTIFRAQPVLASPTARDAYWEGKPIRRGCNLKVNVEAFHGGTVRTLVPKCPRRGRYARLWVIGDSHATAYTRMITRYARDTGTPVTLISRPNCSLPSLWRPRGVRRACRGFQRAALAELSRKGTGDDLIFLPGLRVSRLQDGWTGKRIDDRFTPREQAEMYADALTTLSALSATGAKLVLEAPLPVFRSPAFRCSDWFNRSNPICRGGFEVGRAELLAHRAPVVERMERLARTVPNLAIWDPFPTVCPGSVCSAHRDGRPLFVDGDHISGRGNDLLYPSFRRTISAISRQERAGVPPATAR